TSHSRPKRRGVTTAVATPDRPSKAQAEKPPQAFGSGRARSHPTRNSPQKAMHEELMEQVVTQENATAAWLAVKRNGGAPGIDGMTTQQLRDHVRKHWETIRAKLLSGTYVPSPVRRVEIPKPNGGVRLLGIPAMVDRAQQALHLQGLEPTAETLADRHSYGFRLERSTADAIAQCFKILSK